MNKLSLIAITALSVLVGATLSRLALENHFNQQAQKIIRKTQEVPNDKNPLLILSPNKADFGQKIIVEGKNFCSKKACSKITIKLEELTLATNILAKNGKFKEIVQIKKPQRKRNSYLLVAQQKVGKNLTETATELEIYQN